MFGDFDEVFLIACGDDDVFCASAACGDDFFLDTADGEDVADEGDFSGHGKASGDGFLAEEGEDGGDNGDTSGGAIFGDSASGEVDVEFGFFKCFLFDAESFCVGSDVAERDLNGFGHDLTEFSGEFEATASGHFCGFDE